MDLSVTKPANADTPLMLLELNELNFEYVEHYGEKGELPMLNRLFDRYGYQITRSEQVYEHIEPWIQWIRALGTLPAAKTPVLEIYRLYNRIVADCLALEPRPRIMIATALHRDPVDEPVYHWRFKNHQGFLRSLGIRFRGVEPRMSRDFLVTFGNAADAAEADAVLASGRDSNGVRLFEVDNRGNSLFVMLTYPFAIESGFTARFGRLVIEDFAAHVVFVAIKNSHHNGSGYFLDTGAPVKPETREMPLTEVWQRVQSAF